MSKNLSILNKDIRTLNGLYSLNDLHKASGNLNKHKPSLWSSNKQTNDLIKEIEKAGIPAILKKQGLGTFVCIELVCDYASWISAQFHLHVIRTFLQNKPIEQPKLNSTLTEDQIGHVYNSVHAGCANVAKYDRSKYFAEVWGSVKRQFKVASYREVKATDYPALCDFIGVPPKSDFIQGELLPKKAPKSQDSGIAMMEFGGLVERVQNEKLRIAQALLNEAAGVLSEATTCGSAIYDGFHESSIQFSFSKKDREKGQKKAAAMFQNWKVSKRIF